MKMVISTIALLALLLGGDRAIAEGKLHRVLRSDMINAQLPYLESVAGPAMHVINDARGGQIRDYRIEGCQVEALVGPNPQGGVTVQALTLTLSHKCNFNLRDFRFMPLSTDGLILSRIPDFASLGFESDCISMCGNAADPTVEFLANSSHATNWLGMVFTLVLDKERSIAAAEQYRQFVEAREGPDYILQTKFNCDQKYAAVAARLFAQLPVNKITIGLFPGDPGRRCN